MWIARGAAIVCLDLVRTYVTTEGETIAGKLVEPMGLCLGDILVQQADKAVRYNQLPPEAEVVRRKY